MSSSHVRTNLGIAEAADADKRPESQKEFPQPTDHGWGAALQSVGPSRAQAKAFIQALTGSANTPCTWQTFGEEVGKKDLPPPRILSGAVQDVWDSLDDENARRAGVFVTVNETDGTGRKRNNIVRVRALFIDCDGGRRPTDWHLPPSIIVQSANGTHAYWAVTDCDLGDFPECQKRLARHYGSDPVVHDAGRVMRVPGFLHNKHVPTEVTLEASSGARYTAAEVMAGIAPLPAPPAAKKAPTVKLRASGIASDSTADKVGPHVLEIFKEAGLYRRQIEAGKHAVACPWNAEHTNPDEHVDSGSTSTVIWERTATTPATFKCSHAHCDGKKRSDVLTFLGAPTRADMEFERMNARYVYVESMDMVWDREFQQFVQPKALKMRGPAERQWLSPAYDGKRSTADSPIFEPNEDRVPHRRLNLYDPTVILRPSASAMAPFEGGDGLQLIQRLVLNLAEGGERDASYILQWLAHALRNPGKKSVALVLRGVGGTGKGLLAQICRKIFGRYAVGIGHEQLESRFNGWLSECVLGLANEISAASFRDKVSAESKLKALVTEEMVTIERKGKDVYETPNYAKLLFMANDRVPLIINPQDRRYSVVASGWKLVDKDPELIAAIVAATEDPSFIQLVVDYLHALPLDTFNPHVPHANAAREAVISDGLSGPERWWFEELPPAGRYPSLAIHAQYRQWCDSTGERVLPFSTLMRARPENVKLVTARTDSLDSLRLRSMVGTGLNTKCVDVPEVGQGGTRSGWIAGLSMPVGAENQAALAEAIRGMSETVTGEGEPTPSRGHLRVVGGGAK